MMIRACCPTAPPRTAGFRMAGALVVGILLTPLAAAPEKGGTGISPALDLLPEGSTLKTVSFPRFDQNKNPSALLRAGLMKVITEEHVSGQNVELRVYNANGSQRLKVHMGAADYFVPDGILEASEVLTLSGDGFKARGTGAVFHLESRRGFVHGPVKTSFTADINDKLNTMNSRSRPLTASALGGLAVLTISTAAGELPAGIGPLTGGDLARLDREAIPKAHHIHAEVAPTKQVITRDDQLSRAVDLGFHKFSDRVKHPELLTIAAGVPVQNPVPKADPEGLKVTCDGGMYFDAELGHLVYLKNIEITEPRFTLKAAKELKIFLEKKEAPAAGEKADAMDSFGDVSNIVATGGIRIVRKNDKGQDLVATADTVSYDAKTGDMVLRGGFPTIYEGKKIVRALEPGLYVRIYKSGNVYAQPGKWQTDIGDIKNLKNN